MKKASQKMMKGLDEALYIWFRQQRELDHSVSELYSKRKPEFCLNSCI